MEIFGDPKIIKDRAFVLAMFTVFFLITPGIAFIYLYFPNYIVSLDAVKLTLLSITFTMPIAFINAVAIDTCARREKKRDDDLFHDFVLGTTMGGLFLHVGIISSYLLNFEPRQLAHVVLGLEVLLIGFIWFESKLGKK